MLYKIVDKDSGEVLEWANIEGLVKEGEQLPLPDGIATVVTVGESEVDWPNERIFQKIEIRK